MSEQSSPAIVVVVEIDDPTLADRLASLLEGVAGLRLAAPGEAATVAIVSRGPHDTVEPHGFRPRANATTRETTVEYSVSYRTNALGFRGEQIPPKAADEYRLMLVGDSMFWGVGCEEDQTIARQLGISVHTAKFHVGSLLDKLDATGRTDAVAHAARRGVINL